MGIGIYEAVPSANFTLGWKYILERDDGTEVQTSEIYEEQVVREGVEDSVIKHRFTSLPRGIPV
jgi:hypothetical protein